MIIERTKETEEFGYVEIRCYPSEEHKKRYSDHRIICFDRDIVDNHFSSPTVSISPLGLTNSTPEGLEAFAAQLLEVARIARELQAEQRAKFEMWQAKRQQQIIEPSVQEKFL